MNNSGQVETVVTAGVNVSEALQALQELGTALKELGNVLNVASSSMQALASSGQGLSSTVSHVQALTNALAGMQAAAASGASSMGSIASGFNQFGGFGGASYGPFTLGAAYANPYGGIGAYASSYGPNYPSAPSVNQQGGALAGGYGPFVYQAMGVNGYGQSALPGTFNQFGGSGGGAYGPSSAYAGSPNMWGGFGLYGAPYGPSVPSGMINALGGVQGTSYGPQMPPMAGLNQFGGAGGGAYGPVNPINQFGGAGNSYGPPQLNRYANMGLGSGSIPNAPYTASQMGSGDSGGGFSMPYIPWYVRYMMYRAGMDLGTAAFKNTSETQTQEAELAFIQNRSINDPQIQQQMSLASNLGASLGTSTPQSFATYVDAYRLTGSVTSSAAMTKAADQLGIITHTDPATTQSDLTSIYNSFGGGKAGTQAISSMPNIIAAASRVVDMPSAELEQAVARGFPVASQVGIITPGKAPTEQDLAAYTALVGELSQSSDQSSASVQGTLRMFAGAIASQSKQHSVLKKTGIDITGKSLTEVMSDIYAVDQGEMSIKGGITGGQGARDLVTAIAGGRSGFNVNDLLESADALAKVFKEIASNATANGGAANSYVSLQLDQTLGGQWKTLQAQLSALLSDPNNPFTGLAGGLLGGLAGGLQTIKGAGDIGDIYSALNNNPLLKGANKNSVLDAVLGEASPTYVGDLTAMEGRMTQMLQDPNTTYAQAQQLVATYNKIAADTGNKTIQVTPGSGGSAPGALPPGASAGGNTSSFSGIAQQMSHLTGIPAGVIATMMRVEHGTSDIGAMYNNPLNIAIASAQTTNVDPKTIGAQPNGQIANFTSMQAGISANAWLLNNDPNYAGVRAAIAAHDSAAQIMQAIGQSPWDAGHYAEGSGTPGGDLQTIYNQQHYAALNASGATPVTDMSAKHLAAIMGGGKGSADAAGRIANIAKTSHTSDLALMAYMRQYLGGSAQIGIADDSDPASFGLSLTQWEKNTGGHPGMTRSSASALLTQEYKATQTGASAKEIGEEVSKSLAAMTSWGAFQGNGGQSASQTTAFTISPQGSVTKTDAANDPGSVQNVLLKNLVDGQSAALGYLDTMSNFNVPSSEVGHEPFYSAWSALSGLNGSKTPTSGHVSRAGSSRPTNAHTAIP